MIVFILAVGNELAYKNYEVVEQHLFLTLTSLSRQNGNDYKVVVVANKKPSFDPESLLADYHIVDYKPPITKDAKIDRFNDFTHNAIKADKGSRICSGLLYAQKYKPDYVYFLDPDDWINTEVSQFLNKKAVSDIVCVDKGIFVQYQSKTYKRRRGLVRYCGSTVAYKNEVIFKLMPELKEISFKSSKEQILNTISEGLIAEFFGHHTLLFELLKTKNLTYCSFPFFAACWVTGTGQNVSDSNFTKDGVFLSHHFLKRFGLENELVLNKKSIKLITIAKEHAGYVKSYLEWQKSIKCGYFVYK